MYVTCSISTKTIEKKILGDNHIPTVPLGSVMNALEIGENKNTENKYWNKH